MRGQWRLPLNLREMWAISCEWARNNFGQRSPPQTVKKRSLKRLKAGNRPSKSVWTTIDNAEPKAGGQSALLCCVCSLGMVVFLATEGTLYSGFKGREGRRGFRG